MSWPRVLPLRWTMSRSRSAVRRPSPVVARAEKRMWPDCSPPREAPGCEHLFEDVLVADGGAEHADAGAGEGGFEAHVGHGGGDDECCWRARRGLGGRGRRSMTASPLTTLPFSSAKRARSASPSKVMPMEAAETLTWAATISGWRAPQCSLMLRPSGEAWVTSTVPPGGLGEELRGDGAGGAVGAVEDDVAVVEREAGDGGEEEADVVGAVGLVDLGGGGGSSGTVGLVARMRRKISASMASSVRRGACSRRGRRA
jgi:hypothetical protein